MELLSDFQQKHQTKLFNKYFCVFAFTTKQLEEAENINFSYKALGGGLYAPSVFCKKVVSNLHMINKNAIKEMLAKMPRKQIIWAELANREAQIVCDVTDTVEALESFGITRKEIENEYHNGYFQHCIDNDYF